MIDPLIQNAYLDKYTMLETDSKQILGAQEKAYNDTVFQTKISIIILLILFGIIVFLLIQGNTMKSLVMGLFYRST